MGPKTERLTILRAATHEKKLGDHGFCLSWSHRPKGLPKDLKQEQETKDIMQDGGHRHEEDRRKAG